MSCDDCGLTEASSAPACQRHAKPVAATWRLARTNSDGARVVVDVCDQCRRDLAADARMARDRVLLISALGRGA